ncbi:MAG: hypothetical protein ACM35H_13745 [Bacteroidota bacterium]
MRSPALVAVLAFTCFLLPAAAEPTVARTTAARSEATTPEACLANAKGDRLAQINCCTGHKGVCGCRAGKIVCCDNTPSTEPGCTCHGDDALPE